MDADNIELVGVTAIIVGACFSALSAIGAYLFPLSSVPPNADLATILTIGWQRLVVTVSLAIFGIVGILAGTMLYGFGRVVEEIASLQPAEVGEEKEKS